MKIHFERLQAPFTFTDSTVLESNLNSLTYCFEWLQCYSGLFRDQVVKFIVIVEATVAGQEN